jgi:hypothetical protein
MPPSSVQTRSLSYFGFVWYGFFRCFSSVFSIFLSFSKVFLESIFTREALEERIHFFTTEMKRKKITPLTPPTFQIKLFAKNTTKQAFPAAASVYGLPNRPFLQQPPRQSTASACFLPLPSSQRRVRIGRSWLSAAWLAYPLARRVVARAQQ